MSTSDERETARAALRSWGKRRRILEAERDPVVTQALAAKISIEEIHKTTDLGRSTIDRIKKEAGDDARTGSRGHSSLHHEHAMS